MLPHRPFGWTLFVVVVVVVDADAAASAASYSLWLVHSTFSFAGCRYVVSVDARQPIRSLFYLFFSLNLSDDHKNIRNKHTK